jgi:hypothetical protein
MNVISIEKRLESCGAEVLRAACGRQTGGRTKARIYIGRGTGDDALEERADEEE